LKSSKSIETVSFVGSGNVATHLAVALKGAGVEVAEVFSENTENAKTFAIKLQCSIAESIQNFKMTSDLTILTVPDSKIVEVSKLLPDSDSIVVHTSGITDISVLNGREHYGVFYPLQTFSKERKVDISEVPFCIEANNENDFNLLMELAFKLSNNVKKVSSDQRKLLHLTAVMVNNFSNHMYHLAQEILENNNIDFDFLLPLIQETALKINDVHPAKAQTGPARRKDNSTIKEHLKMLNEFPEYQEIYKLLSEQIMKKYHE